MKVLVRRAPAPALRMLMGFAILVLAASGALAAQSDESDAKMFSLEQKVKIAQFVTKRTRPLANVGFPVAVERTVPHTSRCSPSRPTFRPLRRGWTSWATSSSTN
jgi:hypothetical protein